MGEIGRGAASIIYLVQAPKTKQIKALKHVEKRDEKDSRFLIQAEREYEVAQKVKHPNIRAIEKLIKVRRRLISVSELFLVMEYVDGVSMEKSPPQTFEAALHAFVQVAKALENMHAAGFVHADMKPNNVVVDGQGGIKVIDLGQACPVGTVKERIQGTPNFIAPEQAHLREILPATDVYNLGATMYWCLTRRYIPTAMREGDTSGTPISDSLIDKPTPPIVHNARIPQALSDLIVNCVKVDVDDRLMMGEVVETLEVIEEELDEPGAPQGVEEANEAG